MLISYSIIERRLLCLFTVVRVVTNQETKTSNFPLNLIIIKILSSFTHPNVVFLQQNTKEDIWKNVLTVFAHKMKVNGVQKCCFGPH